MQVAMGTAAKTSADVKKIAKVATMENVIAKNANVKNVKANRNARAAPSGAAFFWPQVYTYW